MKAYVLEAVNSLTYKDVEIPSLEEGWVLVKVKASGICSSDIPRIYKKGTYHFPTIPGHEFSGIVERAGSIIEEKWIGKKVAVFPLIPCRACHACMEGKYEMCENYNYIGSRCDGGFAEYVKVPEWNLLELKDDASLIDSAMLEPLSVALHAVKKAEIKSGDSVNVVGTGMIGIAAALWASRYGAKEVCVLGRNEQKRRLVECYKNLLYVNYEECTHYELADAVVEAVGTQQSIELAIKSVKPGGRIVLMGNPIGDISINQDIYWKILRKQIKITGTWNSSYEKNLPCDWTEARDAIYKKEIDVSKLITHIYQQDELQIGLNMMKNHEEMYCKVMTVWE